MLEKCLSIGGAQVQSLTPTHLKHFSLLKGWGVGGAGGEGTKNHPFLWTTLVSKQYSHPCIRCSHLPVY